jgi:hypothetical protein
LERAAATEQLRYPLVLLTRELLAPTQASDRLIAGVVTTDPDLAPDIKFDPPGWDLRPHYRTTAPSPPYPSRSGWPEYWLRHDLRNTSTGREVTSVDDMVSPGLPIYPDALAAVADFVFGTSAEELGRDVREYVEVNLPDRRGRLGASSFGRGGVTLPVEARVAGAEFRAGWREPPDASSWRRHDEQARSGTIRIPCRRLPIEFRAYLCVGNSILDARGWSEHETRERPEEPIAATRGLQRLLRNGEGERTEFKQDLSSANTRTRLARTVAAFANGAGGTVVVGVDDEGNPIGCNKRETRDAVTDVIRNTVEPPPPFRVTSQAVKGTPLVVVTVLPGSDGPYRAKRVVTIRLQATTRDAVSSEIRDISQSRHARRATALDEVLGL